jgi:hypothetical protein
MKLPGTAQLGFRMDPNEDDATTRLTMMVRFLPKGLLGILYGYAVVPLHHLVFGGMLNGIKCAAESSPVLGEAEQYETSAGSRRSGQNELRSER